MDMHAGSLQFQWLTFSGGNSAVTCLHPLGSNIQFHNLHFDPTDLNLTRHDRDTFWDIQVPKMTPLGDNLYAPVRGVTSNGTKTYAKA